MITEAITQPIMRNQKLSLEELKTLPFPLKIQGDQVIIEKGLRNSKLKNTVVLSLDKVLAAKEKGLIDYVLSAFVS